MNKTTFRLANARRPITALMLIFFVLMACALPATGGGSPTVVPQAPDSSTSPSSGLNAEATSAISVELSWDAVSGATGYRLETQFGQSGWFTLAELDGDQTAYEDFLTPPGQKLDYRLTPLTGSEEGASLTAIVTTPDVVPNPFSVTAKLEEPDYTDIGLDIPGFDPSTFDPSTFDPSTLDIPGIDTGNLDPSSLGPKPVSAMAEIGPEGGSLSITGQSGITYTLVLPPGALSFSTIIVLTPVADIEGYPFTGGWQAGAQIWPEGIYLDAPATLAMDVPDDLLANQATDPDLVDVNVAFERNGQEFHLIPTTEVNGGDANTGPSGGGLASRLPQPHKTLMPRISFGRTGTVVRGHATRPEAKKFTQAHSPTRSSDRAAQESAASQLESDQLADSERADAQKRQEAYRSEALKRYHTIMSEVSQAGDVIDFVNHGLPDLEAFLNDANLLRALPNDQLNELLGEAVQTAHGFLHEAACPSPEAAAVQELVHRLRRPSGGPVQSALAELFRTLYGSTGQDLLNSLNAVSSCRVGLDVGSNATLTGSLGSIKMRITVGKPIPLSWHFDGHPFLQQRGDSGKIAYDPLKITGECTTIDVKSLQGSEFTVVDLSPIFDPEGDLVDWDLQDYVISGFQSQVTGVCDGGKAGASTVPGQPNDLWGGTVLLATPGFKQILGRKTWYSMNFLPGSQPDQWWSDDAMSQNSFGGASAVHTTVLNLVPVK